MTASNGYVFPSKNELEQHLYSIDNNYYKFLHRIPPTTEPSFL